MIKGIETEKRLELIDKIVSDPSDEKAFEELCISLKPFIRYVILGQKNVVPYMSQEDYILEYEVAVWKSLVVFIKEPEKYKNLKDSNKVIAYIFKAIRNTKLRVFRNYVKKHLVVANSFEAFHEASINNTVLITYDYLIEEWNLKHREYNHAHDAERKAYYQAHKEHYHEYNKNYYLAHRDEILARQRIRNERKKAERLAQSKRLPTKQTNTP